MISRREFSRTHAAAATFLLIAMAGMAMAQTPAPVQTAAERLARRLEVPTSEVVVVCWALSASERARVTSLPRATG